jgi:DnaJ-class molecular chaperone
MLCIICGGLVQWEQDRHGNFTHTECEACGAVNCHQPEREDTECTHCDGSGMIYRSGPGGCSLVAYTEECPHCEGSGVAT